MLLLLCRLKSELPFNQLSRIDVSVFSCGRTKVAEQKNAVIRTPSSHTGVMMAHVPLQKIERKLSNCGTVSYNI